MHASYLAYGCFAYIILLALLNVYRHALPPHLISRCNNVSDPDPDYSLTHSPY